MGAPCRSRGKDVASVVYFAATQPPDVCLNDIVVTPTAQVNSTTIFRR